MQLSYEAQAWLGPFSVELEALGDDAIRDFMYSWRTVQLNHAAAIRQYEAAVERYGDAISSPALKDIRHPDDYARNDTNWLLSELERILRDGRESKLQRFFREATEAGERELEKRAMRSQ